jgi:nucleotide-binding universal stress UspA family protein
MLVEAEADPATALRMAVRDAGADLVVMAGHARGVAAQPPFPGSTELSVLLQSPVPVLLVRPANGDAKLPERPGTVLVPVGPADDPETLVASVADFACLVQAHVTLLRVVAPGPAAAVSPARPGVRAPLPAGLPAEVKRAFAHLDGLADALRARGIAVAARVVADRDVAAAILNELAGASASLVAVRPHPVEGQPGPDIEASVTSRVVRDALKPVLVLPAAVPLHA